MEEKKDEHNEPRKEENSAFKKPVLLVGKLGRCPKKLNVLSSSSKEKQEVSQHTLDPVKLPEEFNLTDQKFSLVSTTAEETNSSENIPYSEPAWGGLPTSFSRDYKLEVLKSGSIIDVIDLMRKSYWIFGRMLDCDVPMQHPTISRYHAVLQYRTEANGNEPPGFYIYDLESTHGTFLNKKRLRPKTYTRIKVGHMIKFGCSTRTYILAGPEDDVEEESEFTVTELKKIKLENELKRKEALAEKKRKEEDEGIDWGMGDDADEETDLAENPYAQTNNEELYIEDPKKALRGFMEREGFDLEYNCTEQRMGEFLCKVMLPLDDPNGRPIYAEVLHKGKKKEAVIQCALEACKILDRHGVLRQATHESKKRKNRDWEANDYYDSDEDTFLDRTGTIEKKRANRMKTKNPQNVETYQSLSDKEKELQNSIENIEKQLQRARKEESATSASAEEDSLDSYMKSLKEPQLEKQTISKLKSELVRLKREYDQVNKLLNLAKPAEMPALVSQTEQAGKNKLLPVFGKKRKVKVEARQQTETKQSNLDVRHIDAEEVEEKEEGDEEDKKADNFVDKSVKVNVATEKHSCKNSEELSVASLETAMTQINTVHLPADLAQKVNSIINFVKTTLVSKSNYKLNLKAFSEKWSELEKKVLEVEDLQNQEKLKSALERSLNELTQMLPMQSTKANVKKHKSVIQYAVSKKHKDQESSQTQKAEKKQYPESDNYSMWVPPSGQTGDGRTTLNDKLGY